MARDSFTGLIVTPRRVQWTRVARQRGRWQRVAAGQEQLELPADTADGATGSALQGHLTALAQESGGRVTLGLDSEQVLLRVLDLPKVSAAELEDMVSLQADGMAPLSLDAMSVSHEILLEQEETLRVLVALSPLSRVARCGDWLDAGGLRAERIDVVAAGWWRLLARGNHVVSEGRQVALILADGCRELIVFDGGIPVLFTCLTAATPSGASLTRDVRLALASAELRFGDLPLVGVVLLTDDRRDTPETETLSALAPAGVNRVTVDAVGHASEGVALRATEAKGIDLVPVSWVAQRRQGHFRRRLALLVAASLVLWLAAVGTLWLGPAWVEGHAAKQEAELALLAERGNQVRDVRNRVRLIQDYRDLTHTPMEVFREIVAKMPLQGMLLESVVYRKGETVTVAGRAETATQVYAYKDQIDASPLFAGSTLNGPKESKGKQSFDLIIKFEEAAP